MKEVKLLALVLGFMFLIGGVSCERYSNIKQIINAPNNYRDKKVKIKGIVEDTTYLPLVGFKLYIVSDETGRIVVKTNADLPEKGSKVVVRGVVRVVFRIKGKSLGVYVDEIERSKAEILFLF